MTGIRASERGEVMDGEIPMGKLRQKLLQKKEARRVVLREYKLDIPQQFPYTFEELMTRYPLNNH